MDRRRLTRFLVQAEVTFLRSGRVRVVSLSELEKKVPTLWDGIKAAHALGGRD